MAKFHDAPLNAPVPSTPAGAAAKGSEMAPRMTKTRKIVCTPTPRGPRAAERSACEEWAARLQQRAEAADYARRRKPKTKLGVPGNDLPPK